jgi:hypothetical protein
MEKIIGIIIIFAAGYLMFRLQGTAGGCCGGGDHDHESGSSGSLISRQEILEAIREISYTPQKRTGESADREKL